MMSGALRNRRKRCFQAARKRPCLAGWPEEGGPAGPHLLGAAAPSASLRSLAPSGSRQGWHRGDCQPWRILGDVCRLRRRGADPARSDRPSGRFGARPRRRRRRPQPGSPPSPRRRRRCARKTLVTTQVRFRPNWRAARPSSHALACALAEGTPRVSAPVAGAYSSATSAAGYCAGDERQQHGASAEISSSHLLSVLPQVLRVVRGRDRPIALTVSSWAAPSPLDCV